jgi:chromosome segregation ATPase
LKAKVEELLNVEIVRKELEAELQKLREENEGLKKGVEENSKHDSKAAELLDSQVETLRQIIRERSEELDEIKQKFELEMSSREEQIVTLKNEVESHWKTSEEDEGKLKSLRDSLDRKEELLLDRESENEQLLNDIHALEARSKEMEEEWNAIEQRRGEMEEDVVKMADAKRHIETERNGVRVFSQYI